MIQKCMGVPGALVATFAAALFTSALPVHGQITSGTIQMTNIVANVDKTIDSNKAKAGDAFTAKTVEATNLNDKRECLPVESKPDSVSVAVIPPGSNIK